jgi:formiminotetrahydrofolate cyclodeaminase
LTLGGFLADLGSKKGAPGGGAAAALTGASGAALVEMVARLNDARTGRASGAARKAAALRKKFAGLIAQDARAFKAIESAYKTRKTQRTAWQNALKNGAQPPMRICQSAVSACVLAAKERARTSAWLESDRREAVILLRAAFEAGVLNVEVNLKGLRDGVFAARARKKLKQWRRTLRRS